MNAPPPHEPYTHPADHGVRVFDPDLARGAVVARGTFNVTRTVQGRYYAMVDLDTSIGHLCAAIHIERSIGQALASTAIASGQAPQPWAAAPLDSLAQRIEVATQRLRDAAAQQNTPPPILGAALLVVREHVGDDRTRELLRKLRERAQAGDPHAKGRLRRLHEGRVFARSVLGDVTLTGNFFHDLTNGIGKAVRTVSHAVREVSHEVMQVERKVSKVLGPILKAIEQWGPMILSDIQGLVSMIPGIGTGISAAIATAEAVLEGGLKHPIEFALHIAYGAIPIPPGIRPITDIVLDTALEFIRNPHHLLDAGIAAVRDRIPKGLPQEVFDTLVRVIVKKEKIGHIAGDLASHYIGQYTHGLGAALHVSLPKLPDVFHVHLNKLPDPHIAFASIHQIAPHFIVDPKHIPTIIAHASTIAGHPLDAQSTADLQKRMTSAAQAHAQFAAAMRSAQKQHVTPHVAGPAPAASIAVEVSPNGAQQRVVATSSLAHLIPQTHAGA